MYRSTDYSIVQNRCIASGGVISFYDDAYDSSVLQLVTPTDDWMRDGYACYPEPPYDNTFNVRYNYSECYDAIIMPSVESVKERTLDCDSDTCFGYHPFGTDTRYWIFKYPPADSTDTWLSNTLSSSLGYYICPGIYSMYYLKF